MTTSRLSGLSSGLDVDSLVKTLMSAQQTKLDKLNQQATKTTWKQEDYRSMSTSIVDFRQNKLLDTYSKSANLQAKTTSVTGNTTAVTTTASSTATGSLAITVNQLATAGNTKFSTGITDASTKLSSTAMGTDTTNGGTGQIELNGVVIQYDSDDTMADLVSKINSSSAGATAIFNSKTGDLSISSNKTGATGVTATGDLKAFSSTTTAGLNAKVNINGMDMEYEENSFAVNGINVTVNSLSGTGGVTNVSVKSDTSKLLDTIKSFISDYNSLISKVNGETSETVYRTYTPLTDTQKESMTDDQITLWETKAKSGALRNDTTLTKMTTDLRASSTAQVQTSAGLMSLQSIGITTGSYTENGKLVIKDEDKLLAALTNNATAVGELFGLSGTDKTATSTSSGIFTKMAAITNTALTSMSKSAGISTTSTDLTTGFKASSELSTQLTTLDKKISDFKEFMSRLETSYYTKFTAMETAVNKYNSLSTSLSSYSG